VLPASLIPATSTVSLNMTEFFTRGNL